MSYKQFIQELEDDVLPAEAERRYVIQSTQITLEFDLEPSIFFFFFNKRVMLAFHSDIKNTSRSIFQLKNELFLMLIKMRIGTSYHSLL